MEPATLSLPSTARAQPRQPPRWDWAHASHHCLREARRYLAKPEDAEEAAQEALARAWRRRRACRTPDAPLGWMLQITRREAYRILERRRRLGERETQVASPPEAVAEDPRFDRALAGIASAQLLADLRPDERVLLHLRYVRDLTQPQVAELLDVPEGTVKVRLHRIRHRLRTAVQEAA